MSASFAEFLKAHLPRPDWASQIEGCTEEELATLRQRQQVAALPETYRALMKLVGKQGMNQLFAGLADYEACLKLKTQFTQDSTIRQLGYPADVFVFFQDAQGAGYAFFRAKGSPADPPVYLYTGGDCYHLYAEAFSELVTDYLAEDFQTFPGPIHQRLTAVRDAEYIYDAATDAFQMRESPYTQPPTLPQIVGLLQARWGQRLRGCTPAEIDQLAQRQGVACLPEAYRELMALGGHGGLLMLGGFAEWARVQGLKDHFMAELPDLFPADLFAFHYVQLSRHEHHYDVFRTQGCPPDPPVFRIVVNSRDTRLNTLVFQCGQTLTEFLLRLMDTNATRRQAWIGHQRQHPYVYDHAQDEFLKLQAIQVRNDRRIAP